MVANFEAAVECCVSDHRFADALIIAKLAGNELLEKIYAIFLTARALPPLCAEAMRNYVQVRIRSSNHKIVYALNYC